MHGLVCIGHGRGKEMSDGTSKLARAMAVKKTAQMDESAKMDDGRGSKMSVWTG